MPKSLVKRSLTVSNPPPWMPASMQRELFGSSLHCKLYFGERRVFRKRKPTTCSQWNQEHRVVVGGPLDGSRWKNETTPYLPGIMDASFFTSVETIVICAGPQTGKSVVADGCLYYAMDRDPGPALSIYPDINLCRKNSKDRLQKTIKKTPKLRALLTGSEDDIANLRIQLVTMVVYMGWAGSTSAMSSDSIRYLKMDELDKWPEFPDKKEASSQALAEARTTTFRNRKIWKLSSPTTESGPIWQALTHEAQVIFEFWVKCPECGKHQCMIFGGKDVTYGIKWPDDQRDAETVESKQLAYYVCEHCGAHWPDYVRDKAVRGGEWRAKECGRELFAYLKAERPKKIGFHIPSWLSRFVSLSKVAASFLKGQQDKTALRDFCNKHKAEPWLDYTVERQEDHILARRDERPVGLVPGHGKVAAVLAGVDTQDDGFWYVIRAFGYGQEMESWQIKRGFVPTFKGLQQVLFDYGYLDAEGNSYPVHLAVQDAMGHRTAEVYDFCRMSGGKVIPYKGFQRKSTPVVWSRVDSYPGTNRPIPGGLRRVDCDTTYFKNQLATKLEISPGDPGCWWLDSSADMDFARQMTAEYRDEKMIWQCPKGRANHLWDCEMMVLVAAEIMNIRHWVQPTAEQHKPAEQDEQANPYTGGKNIFEGR